MTVTVLNETTAGLDRPTQTVRLLRTYDTSHGPVRVTVVLDNQPAQSRFDADVWTRDGWTEVTTMCGEDPTEADAPSTYLPRDRRAEVVAGVDAIATRLLHRALVVLDAAQEA